MPLFFFLVTLSLLEFPYFLVVISLWFDEGFHNRDGGIWASLQSLVNKVMLLLIGDSLFLGTVLVFLVFIHGTVICGWEKRIEIDRHSIASVRMLPGRFG